MPVDIFEVSPPQWLQRIARPPERGQLGGLLGTVLGAATRSAVDGTDFRTSLQEAQMTQANPLWRLQQMRYQNAALNQLARLSMAQQKLELDNQRIMTGVDNMHAQMELKAQAERDDNEDATAVAQWTPTSKSQPMPPLKTTKWMNVALRIQQQNLEADKANERFSLDASTTAMMREINATNDPNLIAEMADIVRRPPASQGDAYRIKAELIALRSRAGQLVQDQAAAAAAAGKTVTTKGPGLVVTTAPLSPASRLLAELKNTTDPKMRQALEGQLLRMDPGVQAKAKDLLGEISSARKILADPLVTDSKAKWEAMARESYAHQQLDQLYSAPPPAASATVSPTAAPGPSPAGGISYDDFLQWKGK